MIAAFERAEGMRPMYRRHQSKSELLRVLQEAQDERFVCRCGFFYDGSYEFCYVLGHSELLICFAREDDFLLDGFVIRELSDLRFIQRDEGLGDLICRECGLPDQLQFLPIDLSSWETVFRSLQRLGRMIIVENDLPDKGFFRMGYVTDVTQAYIAFRSVDADGVWTEHVMIAYDTITSVTFGDRYSSTWQKYLSAHSDAETQK